MLFYRVENAYQRGPYRGPRRDGWYYDDPGSRPWPLPYEDEKLAPYWLSLGVEESYAHMFAFASLEQLKAWFYSASMRSNLASAGFRVSVYEAGGVYGDSQAVFKKGTQTLQGYYADFSNLEPEGYTTCS